MEGPFGQLAIPGMTSLISPEAPPSALLCKSICSCVKKPVKALPVVSSCWQLCRIFSCEKKSSSSPVMLQESDLHLSQHVPLLKLKQLMIQGSRNNATALFEGAPASTSPPQAVTCSALFAFFWIWSCNQQLSRNCTSRWHGNTLRHSTDVWLQMWVKRMGGRRYRY